MRRSQWWHRYILRHHMHLVRSGRQYEVWDCLCGEGWFVTWPAACDCEEIA